MTQRHAPKEQPLLTTRPRTFRQMALRGAAVAAAVLGLGGLAVLTPAASPPTVVAPAVKGLHVPVSRSARAAYLQALLKAGYEILPPVQLYRGGSSA